MLAKFSTAAVLALASTVVAQTSTLCNPTKEGTFSLSILSRQNSFDDNQFPQTDC